MDICIVATFMNNSVASDEASNQINFELYKPSEDNVRNKQKRMLVRLRILM